MWKVRHCKFALIGGLVLTCLSNAVADELPSFELVRKRYDETGDLTRVSYLYRRCAAINLNFAALLSRRSQAKAARDYENLAEHYMLLSEAVDKETDKRRDVKISKTIEAVDLSVRHISQAYSDRMKENFKNRGEYFAGDKVLEAELAECINPEAFSKSLNR